MRYRSAISTNSRGTTLSFTASLISRKVASFGKFAAEQNLSPDAVYYFEHALRNPLETVLEVFVDCPYVALGWRTEHVDAVNKSRGQRGLASFGFTFTSTLKRTSRIARAPKPKKKK